MSVFKKRLSSVGIRVYEYGKLNKDFKMVNLTSNEEINIKLKEYALLWLKDSGYTLNDKYSFKKGKSILTLKDSFYTDNNCNLVSKYGEILVTSTGEIKSNSYISPELEIVSSLKDIVKECDYGNEWFISNCIQYYLPAIYRMINCTYKYENCNKGSISINSRIWHFDWNKCLPKVIGKNCYKWSKPVDAGFLGGVLRRGIRMLVGYTSVNHIYMENDKLVWSVYSHTKSYNSKKVITKGNVYEYNFCKKVLSAVEKFGKPVKEVYALYDEDDWCGEMIYRKHKDGEYTITVY